MEKFNELIAMEVDEDNMEEVFVLRFQQRHMVFAGQTRNLMKVSHCGWLE